METGKNIYASLRKNNIAVITTGVVALLSIFLSMAFAYFIYKQSQKNIYAISETGNLIPLVKLTEKEDDIKQVKANLDYFVSLYYQLDGFTMKDKKEKVYWLVGEQPIKIIKDRDKKGYFNKFLSVTGLVQYASINQKSWKVSGYDAPYNVSFEVDIVVVNGGVTDYYTNKVSVELIQTNRNYPYNPYGLLITKLSENLTKRIVENEYKEEQEQIESTNQNN